MPLGSESAGGGTGKYFLRVFQANSKNLKGFSFFN
jgi:hypothetical protein